MMNSAAVAIFQVSIFLIMTLLYVKKYKLTVIFGYIPIIIVSFIVGPERIVIIAYFIFLYYALQYNKGFNLGIGLTSIYFALKSIDFLINVIHTGQGFSDAKFN